MFVERSAEKCGEDGFPDVGVCPVDLEQTQRAGELRAEERGHSGQLVGGRGVCLSSAGCGGGGGGAIFVQSTGYTETGASKQAQSPSWPLTHLPNADVLLLFRCSRKGPRAVPVNPSCPE